jgi:Phytoene dehydrogenase and related proteins
MYSFGDHNNIALLQPAFVTTSVGEMLDSITDNERLKQVLSAITPLYGGVREMTPLYIHALIWDFYNRGAYRIVGGSDLIAKLLCESIRSRGGEIFTDSEVLAVNCSEHKAESLDVKGMGTVPCDYVISDIHPQILLDIIDSPLIRKIYRERICSMKQTVSNFSVYMKFKPDTLPYINSNCYHYGDDVWNCQSYDDSSWPKNFLYMHQCSADGQKFATHAIAFAYMNWDDVARWETTRVGRRGADYEEFKAQCCEKLLSSLESRFPGTRACIEKVWTSTPLTYRDYTGTVGGSMYGILHDKARLNQTTVAQRTKIPNLFLAGQNINSHGILGVTIGAILATSEILGYDSLMTQIKNETR